MSYSENGGTAFSMPVQPMAYGGDGGFGFGGNGAWWLIILLLFANNGWGGGFGFGGGGGMMPWMMGQNDVQRNFDQSAVMNGLTNLTSNLSNCCCENRLATADLKYTVATEACADRAVVNDGIRDLMAANTANTQALVNSTNAGFTAIMDKICQLELDGKNERIAELQAQLNEANRRASQNDQTAQILASQAQQTAALEQYLAPTPRPAWIVQNPNCCTQNFGYGCGCGS